MLRLSRTVTRCSPLLRRIAQTPACRSGWQRGPLALAGSVQLHSTNQRHGKPQGQQQRGNRGPREGQRGPSMLEMPANLRKALKEMQSKAGEVAVDVLSFPPAVAEFARSRNNHNGCGIVVERGRNLSLLVAPEGKQFWASVHAERMRWDSGVPRGSEVKPGDPPFLMLLPLPTKEERAGGVVERGHFHYRTELLGRRALSFQLPPNPMQGSGGVYTLEDLAFFRRTASHFLRGANLEHLQGQLRQVWEERRTEGSKGPADKGQQEALEAAGHEPHLYVNPASLQSRLFQFLAASEPMRCPKPMIPLVQLYVTYRVLATSDMFSRTQTDGIDFRLRTRQEVQQARESLEPLELLMNLSELKQPMNTLEDLERETEACKREMQAATDDFREFFLRIKKGEADRQQRMIQDVVRHNSRKETQGRRTFKRQGPRSFLRPEQSRAVLLFLQRTMRSNGRTAADVEAEFSTDEARDLAVLSFVTLLDDDLTQGVRLTDLYGDEFDEAYMQSFERLATRQYTDPMEVKAARALCDPLGIAPSKVLIQKLLIGLGVWQAHENPRVRGSALATDEHEGVVKEEARKQQARQAKEAGGKREEMSHLKCFTIDDPSTVVIDDGISLERVANGDCWVYVHVADPAEVVTPGSMLDAVARERVTTAYMPDRVYDMLPKEFSVSNSLRRSVPRNKAMTFAARVAKDGSLVEAKVFPSVVNNVAKVSYAEVDDVLAGGLLGEGEGEGEGEREGEGEEGEGEGGMPEDGETLHLLWDLAKRRRRYRKTALGARVFNLPQMQVKVKDLASYDISIGGDRQTKARMLVEECMLLAGEVAAQVGLESDIPLPYRHQVRTERDSLAVVAAAEAPTAFLANFSQVQYMSGAKFGHEPLPHSGIGFPAYCRVTSPLRRYADLLAHQQLKAHVAGRRLPWTKEDMSSGLISHLNHHTQLARDLQHSSSTFWMLLHIRAALKQGVQPYVLDGSVMYMEAPATNWLHAGREGSTSLALRGGNAAKAKDRHGAFLQLPVEQPFYDAVVVDSFKPPITGGERMADLILPQLGCMRTKMPVDSLLDPGQVVAVRLTDALPLLSRLVVEPVTHKPQYTADDYHGVYFPPDVWEEEMAEDEQLEGQ